MGGNQAMQDAATALPLIERLAALAKSGVRPTTEDISRACREYEDEMIPRSFSWVQKSGGRTVVVSYQPSRTFTRFSRGYPIFY